MGLPRSAGGTDAQTRDLQTGKPDALPAGPEPANGLGCLDIFTARRYMGASRRCPFAFETSTVMPSDADRVAK